MKTFHQRMKTSIEAETRKSWTEH